MANTYSIRMDEGLYAEMEELPAEQFEALAKSTAGSSSQGWDLTHRGVALTLRKFGNVEYKPADLVGGLLAKAVPSSRHLMKLRAAWEQIHLPSAEDVADIKGMTVRVG
jgi:hypothetical protein